MFETLFKFIDPWVFSIMLLIGLLYAYLVVPSPQVILRHPTPHNTDTVYKDAAGVCYKYRSEEVKCPLKAKTHALPLQSNGETPAPA